jgi:hypothetical protein
MAVRVKVEGIEKLNAFLAFTDPKLFDKAVRSGLKYAARAAQTAIAKEVGANFSLKAARIKQDISRPIIDTNEGTISFLLKEKPPTALAYGARQTKAGLSVAYKRGQRRTIPNAFINTSKGGTTELPFFRHPKGSINVLHGPSIGRIVTAPGAQFSKQIVQNTTERSFEQWSKGVERALAADARRKGK